ncbi:MAG: YicC family protein [Bacteroidales bacterium]|nr:YicC family protein [Bacteroidales bacterium]
MIKSMTGFGRTTLDIDGKAVNVEIRTLNSKQMDMNTRIAPLFRSKEIEIRALVSKMLERGKVDVSISFEKSTPDNVTINNELAKSYYEALKQLSAEVGNPVESDIFLHVLRMPDVVTSVQEELTEEQWQALSAAVSDACAKVDEFRAQEGETLAHDFEKRITLIRDMIDEVTPLEENRIATLRSKFEKGLEEMNLKAQYDPNRFEQELFYYIEKLDITEEKVRLRKHCNYFLETMNDANANGKKLAFIVQECGREINTLGSKSNDFQIQQIVVRMKDELEKMKEQLANIL